MPSRSQTTTSPSPRMAENQLVAPFFFSRRRKKEVVAPPIFRPANPGRNFGRLGINFVQLCNLKEKYFVNLKARSDTFIKTKFQVASQGQQNLPGSVTLTLFNRTILNRDVLELPFDHLPPLAEGREVSLLSSPPFPPFRPETKHQK